MSLIAPSCRIFVDSDLAEVELVGLVGQHLFAGKGAPAIEADIVRNEDYDSNRRRLFPGGFIYFRYYIDVYADVASEPDQAAAVARVLEGLWEYGVPAVAACNYEETLPHGGGYRSRAVPWPT
jgi:hypothetical protein